MNSYLENLRDNNGLTDEAHVIRYLQSHGRTVTQSTMEENKFNDIDCYVNGVSVSIKSQHTAIDTGNLCFECKTLLRGTEAPNEHVMVKWSCGGKTFVQRAQKGHWDDSWLLNGTADVYLFYVGTTIYYINKDELLEYIGTRGFERICRLSERIKARNASHPHADTFNGLISINTLKNEGILHELFTEVPASTKGRSNPPARPTRKLV